VLRRGYPIAVGLPADARCRWLDNLATLVVERIADDVATVHHADVLRRFLRLAAAGSAQIRNAAEIGRKVGLGRNQSTTYLRLLEVGCLTIELPAWSTQAHLVDRGLAAHLQGVTAQQLEPTDPAGAARFGALLETFVVTEVVKQLGWSSAIARPYHYRTAEAVEVDLVLEASDGRVTAVEVKAGSQLTAAATRGLVHLRDRLGDRFVVGLVLNSGSHTQRIEDRLWVAPVDQLWRCAAG